MVVKASQIYDSMKPEDILAQYNAEIRGLYNYYSLAANVSKECASFAFIMKMSMFKTLGWKLNTSARKVRQKYQKDKDFCHSVQRCQG